MVLKCIASGSSGNCYLLNSETGTLILDCGLPIREIKRGLNYDLKRVVGVCVTHAHKDHSMSVKDFESMGIPVFKPYEKTIKKNQSNRFGNFCFTAVPMLDKKMENWQHTNSDSECTQCPCYGYFIKVDGQKILYVTDTKECTMVFRKSRVNYIILGVNHQTKYLNKENPNYIHAITGHMSLDTGVDMINANKSNALRNVILCHLSQENANAEEMVAEVKKVAGTGINVDYAEKGKEWELSEFPF